MQGNSIAVGAFTYEKWQADVNRSVYVASDSTPVRPHNLSLYRNAATASDEVKRVRAKVSRTVDVTKTVNGSPVTVQVPIIAEISVAAPNGVDSGDITAVVDTLAAFITGTAGDLLVSRQDI